MPLPQRSSARGAGPRRPGASIRALALALSLASGCAGVGAQEDPGPEAESRIRRLSLLVGGRLMSDDAWEPVETQGLWGITWSEGIHGSPLLLEGSLHYSFDESGITLNGERVDLRGDTWDFSAGFLAVPFPNLRLAPYLGLGGSYIAVELETDDDPRTIDGRDYNIGVYAKVGLLLEVSPQAYFGLELRSLRGTDVSLDGVEAEVDHEQLALVFGAGF